MSVSWLNLPAGVQGSSNTWKNLPSTEGITDSFVIMQTPNGTSPTASTPDDTLTFTSTGSTVVITGNASTKTINFDVTGSDIAHPGGSTTWVQYNNSGSFGGIPNLRINGSNAAVSMGGMLGLNGTIDAYWGIGAGTKGTNLPFPLMTLPNTSNGTRVLQIAVDESTAGGYAIGPYNQTAEIESAGGSLFFNVTPRAKNGIIVDSVIQNNGILIQTGNAEFNSAGLTYPVNIQSSVVDIVSPTTVTVTGQDDNTAIFTMPANGTEIDYYIYSYDSAAGIYSTPGTLGSIITAFDTDPASFSAVQNESESGYTANGTVYNWIIYSIFSSGLRSFGTSVTATDNSDGSPFAWDLSWTAPLGEAPAQYYVYNQTTGNAAYTSGTSITDDNSWAGFVDPGLSGVSYNVSWSSVAGAASYTLQGPAGGTYESGIAGLSYLDDGTLYASPVAPSPNGPLALPGLYSNGVTLLKNTLTGNASTFANATLQVWAPSQGVGSYLFEGYDSNGNLRCYIDDAGNITGIFQSITGQFNVYDLTSTNYTYSGIVQSTANYILSPSYLDLGTLSGNQTFGWSGARWAKFTLGGNVTITNWTIFVTAGGEYLLEVQQAASGGPYTVAFPSGTIWPSGVAPTISVGAGKKDLFQFRYDGVNFFGSIYGQNY